MLDVELFYSALGDDVRRRVLVLLQRNDELCVCELCAAVDLPQPRVSRHLALLREAGAVAVRRAGTMMFYRIAPDAPVWAWKLMAQMAQGEEAAFSADAARLQAMPQRYGGRAA